ncbi:MAG: hypothetical protein HN849_17030 [Victivallales bacterium]|nr:hypothetical protein [Victivallales bacterium]
MRKDTIRAFFRVNLLKVVVTTLLLVFAPSFVFLFAAVGTYPALNILRLPFRLGVRTWSGWLIMYAIFLAQFLAYLLVYYSLSCCLNMVLRDRDILGAAVITALVFVAIFSTCYPIYFIADVGGGRHLLTYIEILKSW